jgi:ATP-dependent protease ClpP protease subunit
MRQSNTLKHTVFNEIEDGRNFFTKTIGKVLEFYLSGEITEPENYIDWFDAIRNAGPNDEIIIYINSGGGNIDTTIQFIRVLNETDAHVTTSIEGSCMSAATMIFLQGQSMQITPFSLIMLHNYSGGAFGKGGEIYDNIMFERKWSSEFLHEIYRDFLTNQEIDSMLENKDIWMGHREVEDRCRKLMEKRVAEMKARDKESTLDS